MQRINRISYLEWLIGHKDKQLIKVVSGVRRCGKSTLFDIYRDYLRQEGIEESQIISLNFEDIEYEDLCDYRPLYDFIKMKLLPDKMNYIFLDEVQHVKEFEKAVNTLFLSENCDVYMTGSNAYFMSGELATRLSGRYTELKMLPLSFAEFYSGLSEERQGLTKTEKFNLYLELSSFPYILRYNYGPKEAKEYLRDIYNTVLLKDIVARLRVSDVNTLENVTKFILHNIGNRVSPTKIAGTLKSQGKSVDQKTVDRYLRGLTDSLIVYEAVRYNIKGKQFLTQQNKYYAVDVTLRNILVRGKDSDIGHILENVVYLELLRRGHEVYAGQLDDGSEVDFVAINSQGMCYYQVSATTLDEETLKRELASLRKIADNYPKYLLTLDEVFGNADYEGIQKKNVIDWLLGR
ncbi:ATP-binding protein [Sedimentibacter sp.]|uniref:ATP-binding protein n=1 Tax=Sedimentibacter sp. TaxID=1960295 RepID=UPI0028B01675|nr:ATP-binding protein [Sedimentibacter sp.]